MSIVVGLRHCALVLFAQFTDLDELGIDVAFVGDLWQTLQREERA